MKTSRIKILLPTKLASEIKAAAISAGVSSTKLLGRWINQHSEQEIAFTSIPNFKRNYVMDIRLEQAEKDKVYDLAEKLGMSVSTAMLKICLCGLYCLSGVDESHEIVRAWDTGRFGLLPNIDDLRMDTLSAESFQLLVWCYIEMGKMDLASHVLDLFESRFRSNPNTQEYYGMAQISRSRLARVDKNLRDTKEYALVALRIAEKINSERLRGMAHFRLGIYEMARDEVGEALIELEKAGAHLNVNKDPYLFLQVYLMKALICLANLDYTLYFTYIKLAKDIIEKYPNAYFHAYFQSIVLQQRYLSGQMQLETSLEQNIGLANYAGSDLMRFDAYELAGMIAALSDARPHTAEEYLTQAQQLERKFRPHSGTSSIEVFKLVGLARRNYARIEPALERLEGEIASQNVDLELYKYLFAAVKYIYDKDTVKSDAAEVKLKKLAKHSELAHIRKASEHTLNRKQFARVI